MTDEPETIDADETPSPAEHHQREIADASALVATTAVAWSRAAEAAKAAKKEFEGAVASLEGIIARGPENYPLFDKREDDVDLNWRDRSIHELSLPDRITGKLEGIETIGQLEDLRAAISLGSDTWPKGIGEASITMLEERILDWLDRYRAVEDEPAAEDGVNT